MEDFGAKPKMPGQISHAHKIPSNPVRFPSANCETAHSKLPPLISPKPKQSVDAVEYDDILPAKQYNMEYDDIITAKQYRHSKVKSTAPKITSRPYKLEEFAKSFTLPQIVRASNSADGSTFCKGEEFAILFSKTTKTVLACREGEIYDVPMNSTFEFGPCNEKDESSQNYNTIQDLVVGSKDLPLVAKVLKSYKGKTEKSSVVAGSLIFPRKLKPHSKKQVLVCTSDHSNETLNLGLSCAGNFSTHPSDVKVSLMQYIFHINKFPIKVKAFNYRKLRSTKSYIEMGAEFELIRYGVVHSYICTTDIFGENGYPLFELFMQTPISVQCIQHDCLDIRAILNKARTTYTNFGLSLINNHITFCKHPSHTEIQQEFYQEVTLDIANASDYFEITKPNDKESNVYECMSDYSTVDQVFDTDYSAIDQAFDTKKYQASVEPPPPLPSAHVPQDSKTVDFASIYPPKPLPKSKKSVGSGSPTIIPPQKHATLPNTQSTQVTDKVTKQNIAYLQSLSGSDMLHLLDRMNLGQHKDSFKQEQVDGALFTKLTATELEELGITKSIHQKRLLSLIDGTVSVRKFIGSKTSHSQEDEEEDSQYVIMSPT